MATAELVQEVRVQMVRQQGALIPGSVHLVPVGQAYEMLKIGSAKIHPDSAKDYEPWAKMYKDAEARDDKAAAERGAKNAREQAEAAKVANDARTLQRLAQGRGGDIPKGRKR
jgi:hypothetical protein